MEITHLLLVVIPESIEAEVAVTKTASEAWRCILATSWREGMNTGWQEESVSLSDLVTTATQHS